MSPQKLIGGGQVGQLVPKAGVVSPGRVPGGLFDETLFPEGQRSGASREVRPDRVPGGPAARRVTRGPAPTVFPEGQRPGASREVRPWPCSPEGFHLMMVPALSRRPAEPPRKRSRSKSTSASGKAAPGPGATVQRVRQPERVASGLGLHRGAESTLAADFERGWIT